MGSSTPRLGAVEARLLTCHAAAHCRSIELTRPEDDELDQSCVGGGTRTPHPLTGTSPSAKRDDRHIRCASRHPRKGVRAGRLGPRAIADSGRCTELEPCDLVL
jgi:hypothetical protein